MNRLAYTVRKGTELGNGRKRAVLTDDVIVDIEFDEAGLRQLAWRAVLNKSNKAVDGPVTAKVRRS